MSKKYTTDTASYITKRQSRENVASDMKQIMNREEKNVIHYLGGTSTQTPFEDKFDKNVSFFRYERMLSITPSKYKRVLFDDENAIFPSETNRYFINDDFFTSFSDMYKKSENKETHLWLDFCAMPNEELLENILHTFLTEYGFDFKTLYITFFMNPRNCKEVKDLFKGEKNLEEKANILCKELEDMNERNDLDFSVFETYNNRVSPMAVLKIERREMKNMATTASVENYVRLHKKGFSNKQIAIFWRAGIMQVAGFAASAKRSKMI